MCLMVEERHTSGRAWVAVSVRQTVLLELQQAAVNLLS